MAPDLSIKIAERKQKELMWRDVELPRRIETDKTIKDLEHDLLQSKKETNLKDNNLSGMVASRSKECDYMSGEAVTLKEFDPSTDFNKKILVTQYTDPGWTIIFPALKGIIVERGGMLSHAAIVARELNIPCIVGVTNATNLIKNGSLVSMDLNNGKINIVN